MIGKTPYSPVKNLKKGGFESPLFNNFIGSN